MRVAVIGTGHVGLVTSATVAEIGHDVIATDNDKDKIDTLGRGTMPFFEPGLKELVAKHIETGRLRFTDDPAVAGGDAQVVFICVGTPPRATGEANMLAVERSVKSMAPHLRGRTVIVEKSTVPAGTSQRLKRILRQVRPDLGEDLQLASNPEFLREGHAIEDSLHPERILVGTDSEWAQQVMKDLYRPLIDAGHDYISTNIATAELSKHACNAFLALKISYANALARLCERVGADVIAVADIMGLDKRIGREFLNAGLGYGGSCFPKDLAAFERLSSELGYEFPLLGEIARINEQALDSVLRSISDALWNLEDKRVALLGLSFKPETDDTRFSPALALARKLLAGGAQVVGYDPRASAAANAELPEIEIAPTAYDAVSQAHCLVLCTEWEEFSELDFNRVKELMDSPVVVDARNFFDPQSVAQAGLAYYPVGRPPLLHNFET